MFVRSMFVPSYQPVPAPPDVAVYSLRYFQRSTASFSDRPELPQTVLKLSAPLSKFFALMCVIALSKCLGPKSTLSLSALSTALSRSSTLAFDIFSLPFCLQRLNILDMCK